jgi:hypothetical protein
MKILKHANGKVWIFSESVHGWVAATDESVDAGEVLQELIKLKIQGKKDLSYSMAFSEVGRENPELAKRYLEQLRGQRR